MATVIHSVKDGVDQIIETASMVQRRVEAAPESPERETVLREMGAIKSAATRARSNVEKLGRRS